MQKRNSYHIIDEFPSKAAPFNRISDEFSIFSNFILCKLAVSQAC